MNAIEIFDAVARAVPEVEFHNGWHGPQHRLENFVSNLKFQIPAGTVMKTHDDCGRKVLLRGTSIGNLAIFERYMPGHGPRIFVGTASLLFKAKERNVPFMVMLSDAMDSGSIKHYLTDNI